MTLSSTLSFCVVTRVEQDFPGRPSLTLLELYKGGISLKNITIHEITYRYIPFYSFFFYIENVRIGFF